MLRLGRSSTIIIARRLSLIRNSDYIALMEEGQLVEMGTHDELITLDGLYGELPLSLWACLFCRTKVHVFKAGVPHHAVIKNVIRDEFGGTLLNHGRLFIPSLPLWWETVRKLTFETILGYQMENWLFLFEIFSNSQTKKMLEWRIASDLPLATQIGRSPFNADSHMTKREDYPVL